MDKCDAGKPAENEESSQLNRNRSFKSKQLVRSQAIRESTSPPRTSTPCGAGAADDEGRPLAGEELSSHCGNNCDDEKRQPVEIQITSGSWDMESQTEQRLRTKRWLVHKHHSDSSRDLLSNGPRVTCVCGACAACPHCRGRRRRLACPSKQDSGIVCSDECPDCTDEVGGASGDGARKAESLDVDDQGVYCRCSERKDKPKSASLCKSDSEEKMEPDEVDLVNFIRETLNKNGRDRVALLRIEKELHSLVSDNSRCIVRFPVMTSYGRMLVHRCAALFQLAHHLDQTTKSCVLVSKSGTSGGRLPCTSFRDWCTANFPPSPQRHQDTTHAKCILKRSTASLEEGCGSRAAARSKSLEQREREYERVRKRIFSTDGYTQDESQWLNPGAVKLLAPDANRNKLQKVHSLEVGSGCAPASWRRGPVSKSHSFGGYAGGEAPQPRLLSRQGDLASSSWRVSPSSSGYKTLSMRSTDSVTPSPTGENVSNVASPEPAAAGTLVWAVTDLSSVPPGVLVIHPQTGRPLTNPDGTVYHFDPTNPPRVCDVTYDNGAQSEDNEKKRGRLEKQNSFIDNESECRHTDSHTKCCCECRRHNGDKTPTQTNTEPPSPSKSRYEKPEIHDTIEKQQESPKQQDQNQVTEENQYELSNPQPTYEPTQQQYSNYELPTSEANQRTEANNGDASTNQNAGISTNQRQDKNQEFQYVQYPQVYRSEEISSSQTHPQQYMQHDMNMMLQKVTPIPMQEPNIRPLSVPNVVYPTQMPNYAYMNQCRIDAPLQPVYQQMQPEEQKLVAPQENTFRIDPSYPFATDMSACGACCPEPRRGYVYEGVAGTQVPAYPLHNVHNVLIQQPPMQPAMQPYPIAQYQEHLQWNPVQPKVYLQEVYPIPQYQPQYNVMYPQMLPQPYPICQPVYPIVEKHDAGRRSSLNWKRNSTSGSARTTPHDEVPYKTADARQGSNEIATKIQQIKDQMAQMSTRDRERERDGNRERARARGTEDWKRNSGNGILGSYPVSNGRVVGPINDESQLSSAAREIVNSIRNMQTNRHTYQDTRRLDQNHQRDRQDRPDHRRHRQDRDERPTGSDDKGDRDRRMPVQMQYRPPYIIRQMSPGAWYRRSPGPVHPVMNTPRRPHPDSRNFRR